MKYLSIIILAASLSALELDKTVRVRGEWVKADITRSGRIVNERPLEDSEWNTGEYAKLQLMRMVGEHANRMNKLYEKD